MLKSLVNGVAVEVGGADVAFEVEIVCCRRHGVAESHHEINAIYQVRKRQKNSQKFRNFAIKEIIMGRDARHIVTHNFENYDDREAILKFLNETADKLRRFFMFKEIQINTSYLDEGYCQIYIPEADIVSLDFHNGYWLIDTAYNYSQYLNSDFVRRLFFDFTRALGATEGWCCDDYWDWLTIDSDTCSFEDWYKAAKEQGIGEYEDDIVKHGRESEYRIVHDSFSSLYCGLDDLRKRFPQYQINSLVPTGNNFLRVYQNEQKILLDIKTGEKVTETPLEEWEESLNNIAYVIKQNGLSRLMAPDGHFLTDFVVGKFEWKWDRHCTERTGWTAIIYNEEANIAFRIWLDDETKTFEPITMEYALYEPK